jgi:hypothetical protein
MNTIKIFFILSAVLFTSVVKGQATINPAIKASLDAFIEHSNKKEWDKAFDMLYPKLFTKVPKQELVDLMAGMEADGMSINMQNTRITSTSVPVEEGNETFVRVEYVADLQVDIKPQGIYDYPKSISAIDEEFRKTYGGSNVKWVADNKQFKIIARKAMMAIETEKGNWKLVEINMDQPELMEYLFSPSIMEALVRLE